MLTCESCGAKTVSLFNCRCRLLVCQTCKEEEHRKCIARTDVPPINAQVERLREVLAATRLSDAAILAGVVPLMRDVCMAVLQAHKGSTGLDTLDERIRAQEDDLVRIASMLAL